MKRTYTQQTTQDIPMAVVVPTKKGKKISRKRKQKITSSIVRFPTVGFPTKLTAKLRYVECFNLVVASGVTATYNFAANGLFDPNITGVGHQPMYFDQYMAVYNHYTVLGSKITVTASNSSSTVPMNMMMYLNDDATAVSGTVNTIEESNSTYAMISSINAGAKTMVCKFSGKGTFGGALLSDPNLQGTATANPTELSVFTVSAQSSDLTSSATLYCIAVIEYVATFQELKDPASN